MIESIIAWHCRSAFAGSSERVSACMVQSPATMFRATAAVQRPDVRSRLVVDAPEPHLGDRARRGGDRAAPLLGRDARVGLAAQEPRIDAVLARRLEHHPADRRGVVEDVADARVQALDVERLGAAKADLLLRGEHELDARVRRAGPDDLPDGVEHRGDGRLVVGAEDPVLGVRHDAVLHDRAISPAGVTVSVCAQRKIAVPRSPSVAGIRQ